MLNKIRSKKIFNIIFAIVSMNRKLKLLRYNNKMQYKLNLTKKDFEDFTLLKELNETFDLDIKGTDEKVLNLNDNSLGIFK